MKNTLSLSLILQVITIFCFIYFFHKSNEVQNDGGGLELWLHYGGYAAIAFYSAIGLWLITLLTALFTKTFKTTQGQVAILIPPLLAVIIWLSL